MNKKLKKVILLGSILPLSGVLPLITISMNSYTNYKKNIHKENIEDSSKKIILDAKQYDALSSDLKKLFKVSKYKWFGHSRNNILNKELPNEISFKRIYTFKPIKEQSLETKHNYYEATKYLRANNNVLSLENRNFGKIVTIANEELKIPNGYNATFLWLTVDANNNLTSDIDVVTPKGMRRIPYQYTSIRNLKNSEYNSLTKYNLKLNKDEYDALPNNLQNLFKVSKYQWSGSSSSNLSNLNLPIDIKFIRQFKFNSLASNVKDPISYPDYDETIKYIDHHNNIISSNYEREARTIYSKKNLEDKTQESESFTFKDNSLNIKRIGVGFNVHNEKTKRMDPNGDESWIKNYNLYYLYSTTYDSNYDFSNWKNEYKAKSPEISFFDWNQLLQINPQKVIFKLIGPSSTLLSNKIKNNSSLEYSGVTLTNISKKSVAVNGEKLNEKNKFITLDSYHGNNYMDHDTGIEIICDDDGNITRMVPFIKITKQLYEGKDFHENTRYNVFPNRFEFFFTNDKAKGTIEISDDKLQLPDGYQSNFIKLLIRGDNITNQINIVPPAGITRTPYEYLPIKALTHEQYKSLPHSLQNKTKKWNLNQYTQYTLRLNKDEYNFLPSNLKKIFRVNKYKWHGHFIPNIKVNSFTLPADISFLRKYSLSPLEFKNFDLNYYSDYISIMNSNKIITSNFKNENKKILINKILYDKGIDSKIIKHNGTSLDIKRIGVGFNSHSYLLSESENYSFYGIKPWVRNYNFNHLHSTKYPEGNNIQKLALYNFGGIYKILKNNYDFGNIFSWSKLTEMNINKMTFYLKGIVGGHEFPEGKSHLDNNNLNNKKITLSDISKKSVIINGVTLDKDNRIFILDNKFKYNGHKFESGLKISYYLNGNIKWIMPYLKMIKKNHQDPKIRYNLFATNFNFEFESNFLGGDFTIGNVEPKLPNGYKSKFLSMEVANHNNITERTDIIPPPGVTRTPYEYSPVKPLTYDEYNLLPKTLKSKAKIGIVGRSVFLRGLRAFGQNGAGYVNFDTSNLIKKGISNFKYEIVDKVGNKINNFNICNGDIIKYSFSYKLKKYEYREVINNLFRNTKELFNEKKFLILKAISQEFNRTSDNNFKIERIKGINSNKDIIYKISLLKDVYSHNKRDYFYIVISSYNDLIIESDIVFERSSLESGEIILGIFDFKGESDTFNNKIYIKIHVSENSLFKPKSVYNILSTSFYNSKFIDKLEKNTKIKKYYKKDKDGSEISYNVNIPYVKVTLLDKTKDGWIRVLQKIAGVAGEIATIGLAFKTGLVLTSITKDSSWLLLGIDKATLGVFQVEKNISPKKVESFSEVLNIVSLFKTLKPSFNYNKFILFYKGVLGSAKFVKILKKYASTSENIGQILGKNNDQFNLNNIVENKLKDKKIVEKIKQFLNFNKNPNSTPQKMVELSKELHEALAGTEDEIILLREIKRAINKALIKNVESIKTDISKNGGIINLYKLLPWFKKSDEAILVQEIETKFRGFSSGTSFKKVKIDYDWFKSKILILGDKKTIVLKNEKIFKNDLKKLKLSFLT